MTTAPASSASPANRSAAVRGLMGALRSAPPWSAAAGVAVTRLTSSAAVSARIPVESTAGPKGGRALRPWPPPGAPARARPSGGRAPPTLPAGHALSVGATKAGLVEVRRVPHRVSQPSVRLPDLDQQLVEAFMLVEPPAHLVDPVGHRQLPSPVRLRITGAS